MKNKILILLISFSTIQLAQAQNRMVLSDNVYIKIDDNAYVVIENKKDNAITVTNGGNIISEGEGNIVKWNIQDTTGNYIVPFTTNSNVKIPLTINITTGGTGLGYINFATYETTNDNNTAYPTGVNNMLGSCSGDNSLFVVDRFWRIESNSYATKPTPVISFGYDDAANEIGATNTITESKLKAQRYNLGTNSWETPQNLYGITNTTLNQVQNSSVTPTDFYTWWTLVDTSSVMLVDKITLIKTDDNCGENTGSVTANVVSTNPLITYSWNTGATGSVISNLPEGAYTVTVSDTSGCTSSETIDVLNLEIDCDFFVYIPNFFSPNGDGQNDVFFVEGKGITDLSVQIYNRWGNKVFETNDVNDGWDGKHKGSVQNTAVFIYVLKATFLNGKIVTKSGDVSLVR